MAHKSKMVGFSDGFLSEILYTPCLLYEEEMLVLLCHYHINFTLPSRFTRAVILGPFNHRYETLSRIGYPIIWNDPTRVETVGAPQECETRDGGRDGAKRPSVDGYVRREFRLRNFVKSSATPN